MLQLIGCIKSTPLARIRRWRSTLRHSFPLSINDVPIDTVQYIKNLINTAHQNRESSVKFKFGIMDKTAMHPQTRVPIIFNDQLNIIAQYLSDIKLNVDERNLKHQEYLSHILPKVTK